MSTTNTNLNKTQLSVIRETQSVLLAIKNGETVFFNIAQYTKLDLVRPFEVKTSKRSAYSGEFLTRTKWLLTAKGNRIANAII